VRSPFPLFAIDLDRMVFFRHFGLTGHEFDQPVVEILAGSWPVFLSA